MSSEDELRFGVTQEVRRWDWASKLCVCGGGGGWVGRERPAVQACTHGVRSTPICMERTPPSTTQHSTQSLLPIIRMHPPSMCTSPSPQVLFGRRVPGLPGAQWTGVVTGIATSMLESGAVDAVVCVQSDPQDR